MIPIYEKYDPLYYFFSTLCDDLTLHKVETLIKEQHNYGYVK